MISLLTEQNSFKVIRNNFVKSIKIAEGSQSTQPPSQDTNERFNVPENKIQNVPLDSLPEKLSSGTKIYKELEQEYKVEKMLRQRKISPAGSNIFTKLFQLLPRGDVTMSDINEILIFENHYRIVKPYREQDVQSLGTDDGQLNYIKRIVATSWAEIEDKLKGGWM